jgi:hypothetical protein
VLPEKDHFLSLMADDEIEDVQNVTAKDTQVRGIRVCEGSELSGNANNATVFTTKFDDDLAQDVPTSPANSLQRQVGRGRTSGHLEFFEKPSAQDGSIGLSVHQKTLSPGATVCSRDMRE